jgi:prepilin-type N-terminal cleavage/methylation domain-containing protein
MFTGSEDQERRSVSFPGNVGCRVAHASRVLVSPSRRNNLSKSPRWRDASVSTRDACATQQPVLARRTRVRAFTLLEIMLAVIILGMMSLAIYRFVQANVTAMRVSSEVDSMEARYDGLRELLTQQLQSLPPGTGALAGESLRIEGHDRDELTWFCAAGPGLLTRYATGDFRVSLRLRPHDAKSRQLDLGLLRKPKDDTAVSNEHETWVRLIDNVGTLQIRFFDSRLNTWVQRWTDAVTLPRLVKVVIGRTDATAPREITVPLARMPL